MIKKIAAVSGVGLLAYLLTWPVEVEPVAWTSPEDKGYTGEFAQNQHLSQIQRIELNDQIGPEDLALGKDGKVYFALLSGDIQSIDNQGNISTLTNTGGRPLGIEFDPEGNLLVADAFEGLLSVDPKGQITSLVTEVDGITINYADDVDIADNGKIYFSDASTKFHAKAYGTFEASLLDINEHGGHGRLIEFDPVTKQSKTLLDGLNFANGVAVSHDQNWVVINETGTYRILKVGIADSNKGQVETLIDNLPGFPDNISRGENGVYWFGLVSPRSKPLDMLSESAFLRKIVQRLPAFMRPKAKHFGHIVAINDEGKVIHNLQDPLGMYGHATGALEVGQELYVSSLHEPALAKTVNVNYKEPETPEMVQQ
mgnify:CR=1 FL=1